MTFVLAVRAHALGHVGVGCLTSSSLKTHTWAPRVEDRAPSSLAREHLLCDIGDRWSQLFRAPGLLVRSEAWVPLLSSGLLGLCCVGSWPSPPAPHVLAGLEAPSLRTRGYTFGFQGGQTSRPGLEKAFVSMGPSHGLASLCRCGGEVDVHVSSAFPIDASAAGKGR